MNTELNYATDPRNCEPAKKPILYTESTDIELPTKYKVCPVCNGAGKHVNPSVDCDGLNADDFAEDPDFYDDYMGGTYDVTCNHCNGRTTVLDVDWEAMAPVHVEPYREQLRQDAYDRAEHLAELRMGA